mmetsp:Transcript_18977/g.59567  ORF Transcript_18977/g.59567 Transcript_18977/m.59567 type:complete len:236 (-) Transcript_18977:89-796(-)
MASATRRPWAHARGGPGGYRRCAFSPPCSEMPQTSAPPPAGRPSALAPTGASGPQRSTWRVWHRGLASSRTTEFGAPWCTPAPRARGGSTPSRCCSRRDPGRPPRRSTPTRPSEPACAARGGRRWRRCSRRRGRAGWGSRRQPSARAHASEPHCVPSTQPSCCGSSRPSQHRTRRPGRLGVSGGSALPWPWTCCFDRCGAGAPVSGRCARSGGGSARLCGAPCGCSRARALAARR